MNDVGYLLLMFLIGACLGGVFYGGLWLTVRMIVTSRHPVPLALFSIVLRTAAVLYGLWVFTGGRFVWLIFCLLGFVTTKILATHFSSVAPADDVNSGQGAVS